jgi:hypothetical protein
LAQNEGMITVPAESALWAEKMGRVQAAVQPDEAGWPPPEYGGLAICELGSTDMRSLSLGPPGLLVADSYGVAQRDEMELEGEQRDRMADLLYARQSAASFRVVAGHMAAHCLMSDQLPWHNHPAAREQADCLRTAIEQGWKLQLVPDAVIRRALGVGVRTAIILQNSAQGAATVYRSFDPGMELHEDLSHDPAVAGRALDAWQEARAAALPLAVTHAVFDDLAQRVPRIAVFV